LEAESAYREALALRPHHATLRRGLGVALYWQGRYAEAEAAFRDAVRIKPEYARAHGDLGEMLAEQHRYRESEAAYRAVIRITPDAPAPHTALAGVLLAQRRFADAAAECREAIRLNFDEPRAHINLWDALEFLGSYDELEAAGRAVGPLPHALVNVRGVVLDRPACAGEELDEPPGFFFRLGRGDRAGEHPRERDDLAVEPDEARHGRRDQAPAIGGGAQTVLDQDDRLASDAR